MHSLYGAVIVRHGVCTYFFTNFAEFTSSAKLLHYFAINDIHAEIYSAVLYFLGRPDQPFRTGLCSAADVFLDSHISEAPCPIGAKLCHMIEIWLESPNKVGQLGGPPLKKF